MLTGIGMGNSRVLSYFRDAFTRGHLPLLTCQHMRRLQTPRLTASIRARCMTVSVSEQVSLCRVLGRYKLLVSNSDVGPSPHLMLDGYWEIWLTQAILRTARAGMVVADVGANVGYFSLLMADLVGSTGLVHAFEPNPLVGHLLGRSVELNGFSQRVVVHPEPLWSRSSETVSMVVTPEVPQNGRLESSQWQSTFISRSQAGCIPLEADKCHLARNPCAAWQAFDHSTDQPHLSGIIATRPCRLPGSPRRYRRNGRDLTSVASCRSKNRSASAWAHIVDSTDAPPMLPATSSLRTATIDYG